MTQRMVTRNSPMPPRLAIFVPASNGGMLAIIVNGSAIVGQAGRDDTVTVYYEGNLYGYANVVTYADRAKVAAGRQSVSYPTIARADVPRSELRQVGWFDPDGITLLDGAEEAVATWLGMDAINPRELRFSGL